MAKKGPKPYCQKDLLARGWTKTFIARVLGEPDEYKDNPKYPNAGPPMRIYHRARVHAAERTHAFRSLRTGAEQRKDSAKKAVATRREKTMALPNAMEIELPELSLEELRRRAIEHFNLNSEGGGPRN